MVRATFLSITALLVSCFVCAQHTSVDSFLLQLKKHCGKTYEGKIVTGGREGDGFTGKRLLMQVRVCEQNQLKIPFFVGDDLSRVWVLTPQHGRLQLKHDHTHKDGTPDKVTRYGGLATNTGSGQAQFFPADQETCDLLPAACGNIWWITLSDKEYTYNLRRIGSDRLFTVSFDLTKPVTADWTPWGWN